MILLASHLQQLNGNNIRMILKSGHKMFAFYIDSRTVYGKILMQYYSEITSYNIGDMAQKFLPNDRKVLDYE